MLNLLWPAFLIISFVYSIFIGNVEQISNSIFSSIDNAIEVTITLIGTMCLWSGIMKIARNTSIIKILKKCLNPIFKLIFPEVKKESKAYEEMSMNIVSNMMGLGNAATPLGLKAMESLQEENKDKKRLSNSMAFFIILNTASIQIIPTTVIAIRNSLRL